MDISAYNRSICLLLGVSGHYAVWVWEQAALLREELAVGIGEERANVNYLVSLIDLRDAGNYDNYLKAQKWFSNNPGMANIMYAACIFFNQIKYKN
jgi:hypothetical protein